LSCRIDKEPEAAMKGINTQTVLCNFQKELNDFSVGVQRLSIRPFLPACQTRPRRSNRCKHIIRDTHTRQENDEDNTIYIVLDTDHGKEKISTSGLDATTEEIAHYIECFRTKNYAISASNP